MKCFTIAEFIGAEAVIVALMAYVTSIILPEARSLLGIDPPKREASLAEQALLICWVLLLFIAVGLFISFLLCRQEVKGDFVPPPTPTPTAQVSPTSTPIVQITPTPVGPVIVHPPVVVDGAAFQLYVFLRDYNWRIGSVEVERLGTPITGQQMIDYLRLLSGHIKTADAIISVGTASQEMPRGEPFEEGRALDRAAQLSIWMQPSISQTEKQIPVYKLNLGHYRTLPDKNEQRLIIFVAITKIDPKISIDDLLSPGSPENNETLRQKLIEKQFPFDFYAYSKFELKRST
jgi:hypothetical protein